MRTGVKLLQGYTHANTLTKFSTYHKRSFLQVKVDIPSLNYKKIFYMCLKQHVGKLKFYNDRHTGVRKIHKSIEIPEA